MTAQEFRAARVAAGLSVRKAAAALNVAPSTIARWELGASVIPSDAAERIRGMAGAHPTTPEMARAMGRLFAVLELVLGEPIPQSITTLVPAAPLAALGALMRLVRHEQISQAITDRLAARDEEITSLAEDIGTDLGVLDTAAQGAFWLGYYARKSGDNQDG